MFNFGITEEMLSKVARETALSDVVKLNGNYYYVDSCYTLDHGYETMVFACDSNRNVTDWSDLYCEIYDNRDEMEIRHYEIIADLGSVL